MTDLLRLSPKQIEALTDQDLIALTQEALKLQEQDRQYNQLRYYQPVNPRAQLIHLSLAKTIGVGGGNGSSKTDTSLVEMVIRATGQLPESLKHAYPREKLRGPIACRVVCESLTTTLIPIILPKLQWFRWSGVSRPGGDKGHWGWLPRHCLIGGDWQKSWTEKTRILRVLYRNPDDPSKVEGESMIQFMSYDQDPSDFASGDFHFILHDEPPKEAIWNENLARVMRVDGTVMVAMTWPDDPTINVDWIYDEIYERSHTDPLVQWVNLSTLENPHLNQTAVAQRAGQMSEPVRATRIFGQPIRMSNRVHPLFTDQARQWCFHCNDITILMDDGCCGTCGGNDVVTFNHVQSLDPQAGWPIVYGLDPHPRKPHMMLWTAITPNDDVWVLHEESVPGAPQDVMARVRAIEEERGWTAALRVMDPNMGKSPSSTDRTTTWQDSFDAVGLHCDLANDSDAGRKEIDLYLRPDPVLRVPRLLFDPGCKNAIYQMKRYLWDDYKRGTDHDQKQRPKDKHNDYPTIMKYILNAGPTFRGLKTSGVVIRRRGERGRLGY